MRPSTMVVLGLGTNLGDRTQWLARAIELLVSGASPLLTEATVSPVYVSDALLLEGSPPEWNLPFLNLAIAGKTKADPKTLLSLVKAIEGSLGREKRGRWAPREIDIDILTYGDTVYSDTELKIPHPSLLDRPFALFPLADLTPHWRPPPGHIGKGKRAFQLSDSLGCRFSSAQSSRVSSRTARAPADIQEDLRGKLSRLPIFFEDGYLFGTTLIGILNITPDSFSDGGRFVDPENALKKVDSLIQGGARIIDIGAESTRPGAQSITTDVEWQRLYPILNLLKDRKVQISIDTRNVETARRAFEYGVSYINDVSGLRSDEMLSFLASERSLRIISMHSLSIPADRAVTLPVDCDPVQVIQTWIDSSKVMLQERDIDPVRVIFDPGIGFGKTAEQSWEIIRRIDELKIAEVPLAVGHSRKSFLSLITPEKADNRDVETALVSVSLAQSGVQFLRVHDPESTSRALKTALLTNGTATQQ